MRGFGTAVHPGGTERFTTAIVAGAAICVSLASCNSTPQPVGNPDPGHERLTELAPVMSVIPPGVRPTLRQKHEPTWDSCMGLAGTFGWDPVDVDISWRYTGHPALVRAHVKSTMASLGWKLDQRSAGDLVWHRTLSTGQRASAELIGGPGWHPPGWDMQATAPPAIHPVKGC
jgi:hypothetical protein